MTRFVICGYAFVLFGNDPGALLRSRNDLVDAFQNVVHLNYLSVVARGDDGRLVKQVFYVCARESRSQPGKVFEIDLGRKGFVPRVDFEYRFASLDVGKINEDLSVESAGTKQSGIEYVGAVGRSHDDYRLVFLEAVHLHQQLVQRLFAFVVAAAETRASLSAHGVDLVYEHYAGLSAFGLVEQIAHAACAHADEHFDEVGTGYRIEGDARFARDSFGKQRFARSGRSYQQDALRHSRAHVAEFFGGFQEFDDFLKFELFFFGAGNVGEAHLDVVGYFGFGLTEIHRAARAALLSHDDDHIYSQSAQYQQHQYRENITGEGIVGGAVQPDGGQRGVFAPGGIFFDSRHQFVTVDGDADRAGIFPAFELFPVFFVVLFLVKYVDGV